MSTLVAAVYPLLEELSVFPDKWCCSYAEETEGDTS